ncbi:23S rRNA (adenine(2030)-N(6))-methyltransferase RlmJ [Treponema parvum]|uniref:Ribosomal RNA large subunit methyltransferase J n=1 Tax=Treponema parvum TaxID=138851 RepID=A0A975F4J2_9SPIR|nr:23S rRNA (adenine(2030)-N(6))-methyltransferase RlmJ [Treponema parvum]QTQ14252.1 23S rRNA (adenine(2030)-N(6))-methyltransferase RlmJ [Treponema parvum]
MLSYRHAFHAGNHADILKHIALTLALEKFKSKAKPFTVFDTHAGAGIYDLCDERAVKTGEADSGIKKLLSLPYSELPGEMHTYVDICRAYAKRGLYPGSPEIEKCFMTQNDALILTELHNTEIDILKQNMKKEPLLQIRPKDENEGDVDDSRSGATEKLRPVRPHIHHRSGYEALKALSPPNIRRGFAVIDPSYEVQSDFSDTAQCIAEVHKKWSGGTIMLWYPLLTHKMQAVSDMKRIITAAAQSGNNTSATLDVQFITDTSKERYGTAAAAQATVSRLYGSGLFFINPPYMLDAQLETILPFLVKEFSAEGNGEGSFTIKKT